MSTQKRILLTNTNRWPITVRIAIELAKAGCQVSALYPSPGHPADKTFAITQTFRYSSSRPMASLLAAIQFVEPHAIVPCDDLAVQDLHRLYETAQKQGVSELTTLIESSLGPHDSFPVVSSRYEVLRVAAECGVLTPQTCVLRGVEDLSQSCEIPTFPWVLKSDGTWGGSGVRIAHDREDVKKLFLELSQRQGTFSTLKELVTNRTRSSTFFAWRRRSQPSIIAQSYIDGRPANCAVVCSEGRILAGIAVDVISSQGAKGPAIVVRLVENQEMMLAAQLIAARLKLSGFFGLDFMIENGSNRTYLIELNPRCTPLSHFQLGEGRDLIGAFAAELQGGSCRRLPAVTTSGMISYFPQAVICKSQFRQTSFNDIPEEQPELVEDLLHPWSERSLLGRLLDRIRLITHNKPVSEFIFTEALNACPGEIDCIESSGEKKTSAFHAVSSR
jgi:hypothetical protein